MRKSRITLRVVGGARGWEKLPGSVFEQVDRQCDRALEEAELDELVEAGDRVDVLVGAALDDAERDERERIEGDACALERPAERECLLRERVLRDVSECPSAISRSWRLRSLRASASSSSFELRQHLTQLRRRNPPGVSAKSAQDGDLRSNRLPP